MAAPGYNIVNNPDPATSVATITLDATFTTLPRGIYIGASGNLTMRFPDAPSTDVTFPGLQAGTILPVRPISIRTAGTTIASPTTNVIVLF